MKSKEHLWKGKESSFWLWVWVIGNYVRSENWGQNVVSIGHKVSACLLLGIWLPHWRCRAKNKIDTSWRPFYMEETLFFFMNTFIQFSCVGKRERHLSLWHFSTDESMNSYKKENPRIYISYRSKRASALTMDRLTLISGPSPRICEPCNTDGWDRRERTFHSVTFWHGSQEHSWERNPLQNMHKTRPYSLARILLQSGVLLLSSGTQSSS